MLGGGGDRSSGGRGRGGGRRGEEGEAPAGGDRGWVGAVGQGVEECVKVGVGGG